MQILIFSLVILAFILYIIYKIKKSFTKKDIIIVIGVFALVFIGFLYYGNAQDNKIPNAFKTKYENEKKQTIKKISFTQNNQQVSSKDTGIYNFIYIINKGDKEYVCEAKKVEVQKIEDEFVFKNYKEECRLK
jgi:archaellum component FlaF (FlaF/FlaG flagellin family)